MDCFPNRTSICDFQHHFQSNYIITLLLTSTVPGCNRKVPDCHHVFILNFVFVSLNSTIALFTQLHSGFENKLFIYFKSFHYLQTFTLFQRTCSFHCFYDYPIDVAVSMFTICVQERITLCLYVFLHKINR